jgi:hypothetical protein
MQKVFITTAARLKRARRTVVAELFAHGLWNRKLQKIPVKLVYFSSYYGWQEYGSTGEICIPAVSLCRLREWYYSTYVSLCDVVRHEYGHALAFCFPRLIRNKSFRTAFGAPHDSNRTSSYTMGVHLTEYAASSPAEDFAETFMFYLRDGGRLRQCYQTAPIRRKWKFIQRVCHELKARSR